MSMRPILPTVAAATLLLLAAVGDPGRAEPLTAGSRDCGNDGFSSGQVVENRPARRGPVTALPQTLCAELAPQQPQVPVEIGVFPMIGRVRGESGVRAPY